MELVSFNFVDAATVHSDFGAQGNKVCHCFHCFPIYLPWSDRTRFHDLRFFHWPSFLKAFGTRIIWTPQHGAGVFLWPCSSPHPALLPCCIFVKGLSLSQKLLTHGVVCSCLCVPTPWGKAHGTVSPLMTGLISMTFILKTMENVVLTHSSIYAAMQTHCYLGCSS